MSPKPIHLQPLHRAFSPTTDQATTKAVVGQQNIITTASPTILIEEEAVKPMERFRLYRYLRLQTFAKDELEQVFDKIVTSNYRDDSNNTNNKSAGGEEITINRQHVTNFLLDRTPEIENEERGPVQSNTIRSIDKTNTYEEERLLYAEYEARRILQAFDSAANNNYDSIDDQRLRLTKKIFVQTLTDQATAVDYRKMAPITLSILLVGTSVGIVTPAMPFVVSAIGLTPGQYGTVVSAFALAKMTGNIPSAIFVERHGRKPFLTWSLAVIALGVGGIGSATSFEQLYVCRLLTGAGVAALTTASQLMVTDVSTPLNRATTMSPIVSAFAAGTALGPALGGVLVDNLGLQSTFYMVGASYLGVAVLNSAILEETMRKSFFLPQWEELAANERSSSTPNTGFEPTDEDRAKAVDDTDQVSLGVAVKDALALWVPLYKKHKNIFIMNAFYWFALAGAQMTLLPLLLTNPESGLNMTASQVGQVYMLMSIVQVVSNPFMARYLVDRIGKTPAIAGGCGVIASSMTALPLFADDWPLFVATLGFWALGSSMLSTAPLAYISDSVEEGERAQAIAMLRTSGDVGFLFGASCIGGLADVTGSIELSMQSSGGLLSAATLWFIVRQSMMYGMFPNTATLKGEDDKAEPKCLEKGGVKKKS